MPEFALLDYFHRGGPLMWVLLGGSVVAVALILERAAVYLAYGLRPDRWLDGVLVRLRAGDFDGAMAAAQRCRHPVARIVETYLRHRARPAKLRLDAIKRVGALTLERVEARLRILAAIAHLAPLVGLLGTVIGMVIAFAQIQALTGAVKPSDLAGGIWEALITTVFGLLVAIPAMAFFHAFESHADRIARRMELAVHALDEALDVTESGATEPAPRAATEDWSTVA